MKFKITVITLAMLFSIECWAMSRTERLKQAAERAGLAAPGAQAGPSQPSAEAKRKAAADAEAKRKADEARRKRKGKEKETEKKPWEEIGQPEVDENPLFKLVDDITDLRDSAIEAARKARQDDKISTELYNRVYAGVGKSVVD